MSPLLFQREGRYYFGGDFTLGKSVSVDKSTCDVCVSKDIKCTYFGFIILSPCLGTNRSGKESPKFITLLTAFRTVCCFKGTIFFLSLFFPFLSAICISSPWVNVQHFLGKQYLHHTPCCMEDYLLVWTNLQDKSIASDCPAYPKITALVSGIFPFCS